VSGRSESSSSDSGRPKSSSGIVASVTNERVGTMPFVNLPL
jgi:hypothetical protein